MTVTLDAETVRAQAREWYEANWDPERTVGDWLKLHADSGWAYPTWPEGTFGKGLATNLAQAVGEVRREVGAISNPGGIGPSMAGPTIVEHGTDDQVQRFIPNMLYGREIWCQLFSEPGAGSDLAGIQTRAVKSGDEWIVNGQKVWTSGAQFARWGILVARTDPDVPKHQGITYFVIDMHQDGVEVRPLKEMTGGATFNEVFFTDARVPDADVIGTVNGGWMVAVTTLAHERRSLGAGGGGGGGGFQIGRGELDKKCSEVTQSSGRGGGGMGAVFGGGGDPKMLVGLAKSMGRTEDPTIRQQVAYTYSIMEIARMTGMRAKAKAAKGDAPGPEVSTGKLAASRIIRNLRETAMHILGPQGMLYGDDAPMGGFVQQMALFAPAVSIAGGSDEIQRNIIGERVLGLPSEPRIDKEVPFKELKVGTQRD